MDIQIKLHDAVIAQLGNALEKAAVQTIDTLKTDVITAQVMPFDTGDMQNTQTFVDVIREGNEILASMTTGAPQARRLYYHPEYNFQTGNNANAGGLWLEPWISGAHRDFVRQTFSEQFKKEAGI